MKGDTYSGIIPQLLKISDREINAEIKKYRKLFPNDKRSDDELRPLAVNTLKSKKPLKDL